MIDPTKAQDDVLLSCTHEPKTSEVSFRGGILWVCNDCWNRSVYAYREARKLQLAEEPRCEVPGCKARGTFYVGDEHILLCGKHMKKVKREHFKWAASQGGMMMFYTGGGLTRKLVLEYAARKDKR